MNIHATSIVPKDDKARRDYFRQQARLLKATYGLSAVKIHAELSEVDGFDYSDRTVSDWIKGVEYIPKAAGTPWSIRSSTQAPTHNLGYLLRLDLLARCIRPWSPGLTTNEAKWAEALVGVFDDPDGLQVDLVPQLAFVEEYARRELEPELPTEDLDLILSTRPWKDGGEMYSSFAGAGKARPPFLPLLIFDGPKKGEKLSAPPELIGAMQQLNLPWAFAYRSEGKKGSLKFVPAFSMGMKKSEEDFRSSCNWRRIVSGLMKEKSNAEQS